MKSSTPEIPWWRVEPSFRVAAEPPKTPMPAPARTGRWFGIVLPIAIVLAVGGGGAYWGLYEMPELSPRHIQPTAPQTAKLAQPVQTAGPAAPLSGPKPAEGPRLVGPAAPREAAAPTTPELAFAARPSPNLVEGGAPLLAPLSRWEQETVVAPPPPSLEEVRERAPTAAPARKAQAPPASPPSAPTRRAAAQGGIRF
jgi:hypothetical protein